MIYIGRRKYKFGRMLMSHMIADSLEELHSMAATLGIDKEHFQNKGNWPHYDICQASKKIALTYDKVKEVGEKEIVQILIKQRAS